MSMFFKHMMSFNIIVLVQRCFDPQMPLCYWVRCSQFHPLICRERSSSGAIDSPVNYYSSAWIFIPPNCTFLNQAQLYQDLQSMKTLRQQCIQAFNAFIHPPVNPNGQLSESRVSPSTGNVSHRIYKSAGFCFSLNADSFLIGRALMIAIRQLSRTITWIFETESVVDPGPRILCTPCLLNLKDQLCSTCLHTKVHTSAHRLYTAHWIRFSVIAV